MTEGGRRHIYIHIQCTYIYTAAAGMYVRVMYVYVHTYARTT
jgi:hypothetical protein